MTQRKLTRRQAWRIQRIQEERQRRAARRGTNADALLYSNQLGLEQHGLLISHYGATLEVEAADSTTNRCVARQNLGALVTGDHVVWRSDRHGGGVVVAVLPRRSALARPSSSGTLKPVAANIDQVLIVAAPIPALNESMIDRYIVAAETTGLAPVVVLNKIDLLSGQERNEFDARLSIYRDVGYSVVKASTVQAHGLDGLLAQLKGKTSVFVGQSGVGKSSLIGTLLPDEDLRTGAVSASTGKGRHTTSVSRLYHLPGGGSLIDSPGVRDFALWSMSPESVAQGFREFRPFLGQCRFRNCAHGDEPGCALQEAASKGQISARRLNSYHAIVASLADGR
ncbi:MAG: GTPase RsgA [Gammaproteobacteria bacterium SG8_47]|nr:MAG: GTPase RsgA [Gammaproteobacteria bacterium SG8_47]